MKKCLWNAAILAAVFLSTVSCGKKQVYEYPFQNPELPVEERVENVLSLLTPEEKVGLMMNKSVSVDRLGIPSVNWWSEACHGIVADNYTVYPQSIGIAATFNPELSTKIYTEVSDEARANYNRSEPVFGTDMEARYYPANPELSFWCPNINIVRDPRWGRGQETSGEDPYLTRVMGGAVVRAMQGDDPKYYKTLACAKHYAVHSGPEPMRHRYDAVVSQRDLWETYLPAFQALVTEDNVREVMCAYNRYEGEPCCDNERLLTDILRNKWGYDSFVVTDCDAISNFYNKGQHETHPDAVSTSVDAVLSGADLECGRSYKSLVEALEKGLIKESDIDVSLRRVLTERFKLGMMDPKESLPWAYLDESVINSEEHDATAVEAARQSIVLLKNEGDVLPLSKDLRKIAVVGPNADDEPLLRGNYSGSPIEAHRHTIIEKIRDAVPQTEVVYYKACEVLDDYNTTDLLPRFNDGRGLKAEFFGDRAIGGEPVRTDWFDKVSFSTFGAYGFADGVDADDVAVRMTGSYTADFTGPLSYYISSDSGYVLKVNGKVVDTSKGGRGYMRNRMFVPYKSFDVESGKTYEMEIDYVRGDGPFAMLDVQVCRREYALFDDLKASVADADAIVVVGGISGAVEGEGYERATIELPEVQQRLLSAMRETCKPVVMISCSGSAVAYTPVEDKYDALMQVWYPGQGGAQAVADVLFGDFNPGGRLPVTFYASTDQLPEFTDYDMKNRTYRYFTGKPLYPFGFGLSYTSFEYGKAKLSESEIRSGSGVDITIPVTNTGVLDGDEVVQVYVRNLDYKDAPLKALKGFKRVTVKAGKTVSVRISLRPDSFSYYDASCDGLSVMSGKYKILYGPSSDDSVLQELDLMVI